MRYSGKKPFCSGISTLNSWWFPAIANENGDLMGFETKANKERDLEPWSYIAR